MSSEANGKLHLAHIIGFLGVGGMELGVLRQSNALCRRGFKVSIIYLDEKQPEAEALLDPEVNTIRVRKTPGIDWKIILRLAQHLRTQQVDIVHTHNWTTYLYGVLAARVSRVPIIIHGEHGRDTETQDTHWKRILVRRLLARMCHHLTAVSTDIQFMMLRTWRLAPHKVSFLPNGVDLQKYRPPKNRSVAKARIGLRNDAPVIGTIIGTFRPIKGLPCILHAMSAVCRNYPTAQLVIVGDGDSRKDMLLLTRKLGIGHRVHFLGKRTNIPEILGAMDVYVNASLYEGMSNTILEALACGVPVVATAVGGTPKLLRDGKYGILVPPHAPEEISRAICRLLATPELRHKYAVHGRQLIEMHHSFELMIQNYERLYRRLFAMSRRKGRGKAKALVPTAVPATAKSIQQSPATPAALPQNR